MDTLALQAGTDKATSYHGYTALYGRLFAPFRDKPIRLLELGWGESFSPGGPGASARLWRAYFPKADIAFIDLRPQGDDVPGVTRYQGDQADPDLLAQVAAEHGPFDVIIDDASHVSSLTIASFALLWPHLNPGGWYVVEDTHQAYHAHFYGSADANPDPDAPCGTGQTAMQFLRRLADEVNYRADGELYPARYHRGYFVDELIFRYNIAAARKAP